MRLWRKRRRRRKGDLTGNYDMKNSSSVHRHHGRHDHSDMVAVAAAVAGGSEAGNTADIAAEGREEDTAVEAAGMGTEGGTVAGADTETGEEIQGYAALEGPSSSCPGDPSS